MNTNNSKIHLEVYLKEGEPLNIYCKEMPKEREFNFKNNKETLAKKIYANLINLDCVREVLTSQGFASVKFLISENQLNNIIKKF